MPPVSIFTINTWNAGNVEHSPLQIALIMKAVCTSETSVNVCQITLHYNPEDCCLQTRFEVVDWIYLPQYRGQCLVLVNLINITYLSDMDMEVKFLRNVGTALGVVSLWMFNLVVAAARGHRCVAKEADDSVESRGHICMSLSGSEPAVLLFEQRSTALGNASVFVHGWFEVYLPSMSHTNADYQ